MAESLESLVELVKFGKRLNLDVLAVAHYVAHAHFVTHLV
jgi:hypothetical protein